MNTIYKIEKLCFVSALFIIVVLAGSLPVSNVMAREITLRQAIRIAIEDSDRGRIIDGSLEVAEQQYFAERVNFILPEISINGVLPAYTATESFRFFGGQDSKQLIRTTDLNFRSDITLNQALITGGDLTITANLKRNDATYPLSGIDVDERTNQGIFDFSFEQPLLKPSEPKNRLKNRKDDLSIAKITRREEQAELKKDVTEAYFGVLQTSLKGHIAKAKLKAARLQAVIDSIKFSDGIISEEKWLESSSNRLDAELEEFDVSNQQSARKRQLDALVELGSNEKLKPVEPEPGENLTELQKRTLRDGWEQSLPLKKAWHEFKKSERAADYTASGHGFNGTLKANYSLGRGNVKVADSGKEDNNTDSWGVSLNFSYPIWDGGSSNAAIKASYLSAQKSRLEYEQEEKAARANIVDLINQIDISFRKIAILKKQIELTENRMRIARFRADDGQISEILYLESEISNTEAKNKYLEELKKYLIDKVELESKYIG